MEQISEYGIYFSNWICLSLRYNNEIGFNALKNMFRYLPNSIRLFEIHCSGALWTHYDIDESNIYHMLCFSVKYFLLDMGEYIFSTAINKRSDHFRFKCKIGQYLQKLRRTYLYFKENKSYFNTLNDQKK